MHFSKKISKENRTMLKLMLKIYESDTPMTSIERKLLRNWVSLGNTPYSNPKDYVNENGNPMDFIGSIHYEYRMLHEYDSMPAQERKYLHEISQKNGYLPWDDFEL